MRRAGASEPRRPRALRLVLVSALLGVSVACVYGQDVDPESLFKAAVAAQQRGDNRAAIGLYEEVLRRRPEVLVARANLAGLLVEEGRFREAADAYRAALRLAPADRDLHLGLAYAYGRHGDPEDIRAAVSELEPLHRSEPTDEQATMLLGDAYEREGRYAEAAGVLQPLETAHPDDADVAWLLGLSLIHCGRPAEGVERIDRFLQGDVGNREALVLAGEARLELEQFDRARTHVEAALRADPKAPDAQILLGRILEHTGDYDGAEEALRKGLKAAPDNFAAHLYLGALLYFRRNLPEAEVHLRRALELQPASAEARYKLALVDQAERHFDGALAELNEVIKESPTWTEPQATRVELLYRMHRTDEAVRAKSVLDRLFGEQ